jgi:hypothetical protein
VWPNPDEVHARQPRVLATLNRCAR